MMERILIMLLIVFMPCFGFAQDTDTRNHAHMHKHAKGGELPDWAAAHNYDATSHAYFPDYYTFYDPVCGGYLYWNNNNYTFSKTVPPFMQNIDLRKTRVQILKGLSLDLYPELNYPHYMQLYPAEGHNPVPVPIPGNPAH
jgi:hypothetical protein